jgi:hypothetical protein
MQRSNYIDEESDSEVDGTNQKTRRSDRKRTGANLQIYINQEVNNLQEIGSAGLRAFLLKGMADFFNDRAFSENLITSKKLFDIDEIDGRAVRMKNGQVYTAEFVPVVTSRTIINNENVNLLISAVSSVKKVMSMFMKNVRVLSFYFTNEEEILQLMADRRSRDDIALQDAVQFVYGMMLDNADLFKHVIKPDDVKHIEVIEQFLQKKQGGE